MNRSRAVAAAVFAAILSVAATACDNDSNSASNSVAVESSAPPTSGTETTMPESTTPETTGPETTDPGGGGPETSTPETSAPDGSAPESGAPADCPAEPTEEAADELLVGSTEDDAEAAAEACGWTTRVVRRDGEDLPVTMDLRMDRVNVEVTDGEVTAIVNIG